MDNKAFVAKNEALEQEVIDCNREVNQIWKEKNFWIRETKRKEITLGVIEGGLKGEGIMKTICCPFCGRVVAIKLKKSICKQCSITVILNDEEVSIGEAKKMIVICKK